MKQYIRLTMPGGKVIDTEKPISGDKVAWREVYVLYDKAVRIEEVSK